MTINNIKLTPKLLQEYVKVSNDAKQELFKSDRLPKFDNLYDQGKAVRIQIQEAYTQAAANKEKNKEQFELLDQLRLFTENILSNEEELQKVADLVDEDINQPDKEITMADVNAAALKNSIYQNGKVSLTIKSNTPLPTLTTAHKINIDSNTTKASLEKALPTPKKLEKTGIIVLDGEIRYQLESLLELANPGSKIEKFFKKIFSKEYEKDPDQLEKSLSSEIINKLRGMLNDPQTQWSQEDKDQASVIAQVINKIFFPLSKFTSPSITLNPCFCNV